MGSTGRRGLGRGAEAPEAVIVQSRGFPLAYKGESPVTKQSLERRKSAIALLVEQCANEEQGIPWDEQIAGAKGDAAVGTGPTATIAEGEPRFAAYAAAYAAAYGVAESRLCSPEAGRDAYPSADRQSAKRRAHTDAFDRAATSADVEFAGLDPQEYRLGHAPSGAATFAWHSEDAAAHDSADASDRAAAPIRRNDLSQ